ncbi:peptide ABC transporter substrate-binding protein [soil metagenome]
MASQSASTPSLAALVQLVKSGSITRRQFINRASLLGVGTVASAMILNTIAPNASAQESATPIASEPATRPLAPDDQVRGAGGEIKLLQWQAVSTLSAHSTSGAKDFEGAALVSEPLLRLLPDASLVPNLVKEVPSFENGGLAADLSSVTYHLLEGVVWSDGEPFTAHDVVATYNWIIEPSNSATSIQSYGSVASVEAIDDLTVKITFTDPTLAWFLPFAGAAEGVIYPKHIIDLGEEGNEILRTAPIGTGPYKVDSFNEDDQVIYSLNENYREANKPFFSKVNLKGGGDAASAARAVLETGDWDVAWNLLVEPAVIRQLAEGGKGIAVIQPGALVECILLNFSDPNTKVNEQYSEVNTPHPYFSDPAVRQALSLATDRETISRELYVGSPSEPATSNIFVGIPALESPNTSFEFNLEKANQVLDAAGWLLDGDVRKKGDIELVLSYSTTTNPVRLKEQAINKDTWEQAGFKVELVQVDPSVFFDPAPGNDQNWTHFYHDLIMFTTGASSPFPISLAAQWYAGENNENIAQADNEWSGLNAQRWINAEYDRIYESLLTETDPVAAVASFIRLNDILIENYVVIPLVQRSGGSTSYALSNRINPENIAASQWDSLYWNIANWNLAPE